MYRFQFLRFHTTVYQFSSRLAITKLDILDTFPELKICVGYQLDGEDLPSFPADHSKLEKVEPVYLTVKVFISWTCTPPSTSYSHYLPNFTPNHPLHIVIIIQILHAIIHFIIITWRTVTSQNNHIWKWIVSV